MNNITEPLRLAVGSHQAGSGKGCAMNVVSWENGDSTITDMPGCADRLLARIVQRVNDRHCRHTSDGMLCPKCSIEVLDLAHRTVGTGEVVLSPTERRRVWVGIAADQARQVLHLARNKAKALADIEAAERWVETGAPPAYAYAAADAYAYAYAYAAADAYAYAYAAVDADAAVDAAVDAARLALAHRVIDKFEEYTGHTARAIPAELIERAVAQMCEVK